MPRERQKRGRKAAAASQNTAETTPEPNDHKRRRLSNTLPSDEAEFQADVSHAPSAERPFYGNLDDEEQEYFKRADDMLEVNNFGNPEDRQLFLANVYKEAAGKELKLACSQSCSRLLERLILLSSPNQLKTLFQKFNGQFLNLVQHRFASHCCETLFIQSAPLVTQELVADRNDAETNQDSDEVVASMENLFLFAINELHDSLGFLMTDNFASHTLRVLLTVLAGQPLDQASSRSLLRSRKKQGVEVDGLEKPKENVLATRSVPDAFTSALENIVVDSVASLGSNQLWAMATHPTGNPTLQLLLKLELTRLKSHLKEETSITHRLIPSDALTQEGSEAAGFVNGLLYDPIGSRLMEQIVEHAPGAVFKKLYRQCLKDRLGSLARNEVAGYVVVKILNRLSADDLQTAVTSIIPQIPSLAERSRTNVIKALVERSYARNLDTKQLKTALQTAYAKPKGTSFSIHRFLQLPDELPGNDSDTDADSVNSLSLAPAPASSRSEVPPSTPSQHHASLLAQAMLTQPSPLSTLILASLTPLPSPTILHIAHSTALSPLLQAALTCPAADLITRRKLITRLYGSIASLALTPGGSRLVDSIHAGTAGMAFARERVAEELAEAEDSLRENQYARKVWRNWRMDLYKRRYGEWVRMTRREAGNGAFQSFPGVDPAESLRSRHGGTKAVANGLSTDPRRHGLAEKQSQAFRCGSKGEDGGRDEGKQHKTPLEKAREKHAKVNKLQTTQMQAQSQKLHGKGETRRANSGGGGGRGRAGSSSGGNAASSTTAAAASSSVR
ncbi:MAG: Nucleolar protein 9 [Chrysothrix sp. TS-e1954]|nr:MAG: Nucleolar protein 9 [Chrysothrix sp. TS-e1954]